MIPLTTISWPVGGRVECEVVAEVTGDMIVVRARAPDGSKVFEGALLNVEKQ